MANPKYISCVLCEKRTKPTSRRTVNQRSLIKYLRKNFMLEAKTGDVICNKCHMKHYLHNKENLEKIPKNDTHHTECRRELFPGSPPSVNIPIPSSKKRSHAYCSVCSRPGPKLVVVSANVRFQTFLNHNVMVAAGSRCCPGHFDQNGNFSSEAIKMMPMLDYSFVNRSTLVELLNRMRNLAHKLEKNSIDFDNIHQFSNSDFKNLTGLEKDHFNDLVERVVPNMRNSPVRTIATSVGIFLMKLKLGISNKVLSTLFHISLSSTRRGIANVREALMKHFVPQFLGIEHITREAIIKGHTRPLAQSLFGNITNSQVILVLDGTYIYIQKSNNFKFQRRTFSMHKGRPLVKPMVIVTTTGYFLTVLGPYFADQKNNDASILKHILSSNIQNIRDWLEDGDIFIVDRGFRDSLSLLDELGIQHHMPAFMRKGDKQMPTAEANSSRLVTKIRWVVESANARIKRWTYLDHILPNSQIPYVGDFVKIVCAISNKYLQPLSKGSSNDDIVLAAKMQYMSKQVNALMLFVNDNNLERRSASWVNIYDEELQSLNFPRIDEEQLRSMTCGVYQIKLAPSYMQEYLDGDSIIQVHREQENMIRIRIQSRHVSSKTYLLWIKFTELEVQAWYCKCRAGARVVGVCSHIAAIVWYLGYARHTELQSFGVKDWGTYLTDAAQIPTTLDDDSDSDSESDRDSDD